jgi:hypothetical protein
MLIQEVRQQRDEHSRQHSELLTAITALAQATQRLEQVLARLEAQPQPPAQAQAQQPVPTQAQGVVQAQAQAQAQGVAESQAPPPAENLQSRTGPGRWVGQLFGGVKNAAKAILGK